MKYLIFSILFLASVSYADEFVDKVRALKSCDGTHRDVPNQSWRNLYIGWAYETTDNLRLDRSNVALTAEVFEAFLRQRLISANSVPLYFVSAYCLATKFNQCDLAFRYFAKASDGKFSVQELITAEQLMYEALDYRLFFPTPIQYVALYFDYLEAIKFWTHDRKEMLNALEDLTIYATQKRVYRPKRGMACWQIAKNCIIDSVNQIAMTEQDKTYLFQILQYLLGA